VKSKYETITLESEAGVATITLNRPDASNALTLKMFGELSGAFEDIRSDEKIKVVLLTGAGRNFCAGGDFKELVPVLRKGISECKSVFRELIHKTYLKMWNLEKPIIAAVNGVAAGGGCDLALLCDIRVASEDARFSEAYVNIGGMPDSGGTWLLPRLVGLGKACELMFGGDIIDAGEAERIGLVNKVVPAESLVPEAKGLALKLAKGPSLSIAHTRKAIHEGLALDLAQALDSVATRISICLQSDDFEEGMAAFQAKRKPQFKGK